MPLFTLLWFFGSYLLPYLFFKYGVPAILAKLGFGLTGIVINSIAAWIQSKYGTSWLFSLLQSIGARGGIAYPKFWSTMIGSIWNTFKSLTNRQSVPNHIWWSGKSKQTGQAYFPDVFRIIMFIGILGMVAEWYFRQYPNSLQQIINRINLRINPPPNQHSTEVLQQLQQRWQEIRNSVQSTTESTPRKMTEILVKNLNGKYSCPECKTAFNPQGITSHVKSCAKDWCKQNRISLNKN